MTDIDTNRGDHMTTTAPVIAGFITTTGVASSVVEMDDYSTPDNIAFEHGEMERNTAMMCDWLTGRRNDWRRHWPKRLHEAREMLSFMAPDEGRVNQDAEM